MKPLGFATLLSVLLAGCSSFPTSAHFRLSDPISWTATPLKEHETYYFPAGDYTARKHDDGGYFLIPPTGKFRVNFESGKSCDVAGGIYLPNDQKKGINVFVYSAGYTTALNGVIYSGGRNEIIGKNSSGPSLLVAKFNRID